MTRSETDILRDKARAYARKFLSEKYYLEYRELYKAFITNRGVKPNKTARETELIDERQILKENESAE